MYTIENYTVLLVVYTVLHNVRNLSATCTSTRFSGYSPDKISAARRAPYKAAGN